MKKVCLQITEKGYDYKRVQVMAPMYAGVNGIDNLNKVGAIPTIIEATYTSKHKEMGYTKEDIQDYYVLLKFEKIDKLKNNHCTDCWAKAVCLSCPAALLLEKSLEKLDAECYTRRILEKQMILKCAKFSLAKNS